MGATVLRAMVMTVLLAAPSLAAESKPTVKNGLSLAARVTKPVFARRETIAIEVTFANVSKQPITLGGSSMLRWMPMGGLFFTVKDVKSGKVRTLRAGMNPMIMMPMRLENKTIPPGGHVKIPMGIDRWSWEIPAATTRPKRPVGRRRPGRKYLGADLLQPGEYQITVSCKFTKGFGRGKGVTFWTGEIAAPPITVRVDTKEVAKPVRPGGKWVKLFADQPWYKGRKGAESMFSGTLQAVAGAGGMSTLMRTAHYRLGKWRLYTGARKHPDLDKLVGKGVQIRGKRVEMNLEGRHLKEIWPGHIRRGGGPVVSPPVKPSLPPPLRDLIRRRN